MLHPPFLYTMIAVTSVSVDMAAASAASINDVVTVIIVLVPLRYCLSTLVGRTSIDSAAVLLSVPFGCVYDLQSFAVPTSVVC